MRIMARVLRGWKLDPLEFGKDAMKSKEESFSIKSKARFQKFVNKISEPVTQEEIDRAERFVMVYSMMDTWELYMANKLTALLPFTENYMIYTRGRVGEDALKRILGVDKLPILSSKSRVAWLLMHRAHTEDTGLDHRGIDATLAKSKTRAWIVQGRRLAKKIRNSCPYCRL